MAIKISNLCIVLFFPLIITLISLLTLTYHHHHHRFTASSHLSTTTRKWTLLHQSVGISAMHMQLLHVNKVIIFDRTDFGPSNLTLPPYKCRQNDEAISMDCTAHSIIYDIATNTYRPLTVQTDVWCSSGAVNSDGILVQTGGYHAGDHKIRLFSPCVDWGGQESCDWIELPQNLTVQRWYATDHILPDGRVIVLGGRRAFSYEFIPKNPNDDQSVFYFPFLKETRDPKEENNLYPFVYLLPDGNLFVFANQRSVVLDYVNNKVVKKFPIIPGEKRSYPSTGSSVMLPLKLSPAGSPPFPAVDVVVCGGASGGAYMKAIKGVYVPASKSCGRIRVTDPNPNWVMEDMPTGRIMPDMVLLPTGHVLIVNGAGRGAAGWECAEDPVLYPLLYDQEQPDPIMRFVALDPTPIARMYHSSAILLPDGRVLIGGSNPHIRYNFSRVKYPTELSLEAFEPPYLGPEYAHLRPSILSVEGNTESSISYGQEFSVTLSLSAALYPELAGRFTVTMVRPAFSTHSFGMNQRLLELFVVVQVQLSAFGYKATVLAPPTAAVAPPGYYMLFVVHGGVPSHGVWVRIK